MAFYSAFSPEQRHRQSVGIELQCAEKPGGRWGVQSWVHEYVNTVGSVCRVYLPAAPQAASMKINGASEHATLLHAVHCFPRHADSSRGRYWIELGSPENLASFRTQTARDP